MKAIALSFVLVTALFVVSFAQEDKSKRASPPDQTIVTTNDGVTIEIHYSKPSLKGREIGVDIVPFGKVWRTGANEATTFEVNKDVLIQGQPLSAGKYSLYSIPTKENTTIIFNKMWDQWGSKYDESQDALRVVAQANESGQSVEQFTIQADKSGTVTLLWGPYSVPFTVKAAN